MIDVKIKYLLSHATEVVTVVSLLGGMSLQYIFGERKGKLAIYIIVVSTLVTGYSFDLLLDHYKVEPDAPLRKLALISSSMIGGFIIALFIKVAPDAMTEKIINKIKGL